MTTQQHAPQPLAPVDAPTLKRWLHDGGEIALLDVREHGQYGEAHPFYATTLPYSRLELDIGRLVPRPSTRIVLLDEGDGISERAAQALAGLGYTDVRPLAGGMAAWRAAGFGVFAGVNLPSKTFGELAEHLLHTPRISATDLAQRLARGDDLIVLDGRPYSEYGKMNIPGAICCPNGELALRAQQLAPSPSTTIVVNCAGRTRSIIGAQTLIDLGLPNPVLALENGTQGWYLADLQLEHGSRRKYPDAIDAARLPVLREQARRLARELSVSIVDAAQARAWLAEGDRNTFLCDVRTPEEYAAGTLPGAQHTPGGQLIQATDQYVGVRGARIVLFDNDGVRAPVVAGWLVRMGWDVHVLAEGLDARVAASAGGLSTAAAPVAARVDATIAAPTAAIATADLAAAVQAGATLVDVRPSMAYRKAHVQGARWSIRPRLRSLRLDPQADVVLLADDAGVGALAARELADLGVRRVRVNVDTPAAWRVAGLPVAASPALPADADCIDYLFFVHDRHDGNKAAARQYIAWETNLIHQIDAQERAGFRLPAHTQPG
ncbi:rhodanese-like domain-containing protein [Achromobacter aloeverae]|uniref:Sulfurtransferase n=1 Tax=Achromobacter aloeverae TaxID=1750518 RepID=A0A4Q1HQY4_9BURK|nr:rhodanese-like domain-containing protein [Achromobacter aloeverae]RXN93532.1 sulfurtransferase [Achromobacter aloeverae]